MMKQQDFDGAIKDKISVVEKTESMTEHTEIKMLVFVYAYSHFCFFFFFALFLYHVHILGVQPNFWYISLFLVLFSPDHSLLEFMVSDGFESLKFCN